MDGLTLSVSMPARTQWTHQVLGSRPIISQCWTSTGHHHMLRQGDSLRDGTGLYQYKVIIVVSPKLT